LLQYCCILYFFRSTRKLISLRNTRPITMSGQKYVVVGAGPVGALAALYAAHRGHQVEVYELRGGMYHFCYVVFLSVQACSCFLAIYILSCTPVYSYSNRSPRPKHSSIELHKVYQSCAFGTRYTRPSRCRATRASRVGTGRDSSNAWSHDSWLQVRRAL